MTTMIPGGPPDQGHPAAPVNPLPCQTSDPDLFFSESPRDLESAKALCHRCPVRAECLAGAVNRSEPWGVWGGEILVDGRVVVRKRARGRRPKTPRSEEHTSELQSRGHLVCRLLLEKKKSTH